MAVIPAIITSEELKPDVYRWGKRLSASLIRVEPSPASKLIVIQLDHVAVVPAA